MYDFRSHLPSFVCPASPCLNLIHSLTASLPSLSTSELTLWDFLKQDMTKSVRFDCFVHFSVRISWFVLMKIEMYSSDSCLFGYPLCSRWYCCEEFQDHASCCQRSCLRQCHLLHACGLWQRVLCDSCSIHCLWRHQHTCCEWKMWWDQKDMITLLFFCCCCWVHDVYIFALSSSNLCLVYRLEVQVMYNWFSLIPTYRFKQVPLLNSFKGRAWLILPHSKVHMYTGTSNDF